MIKFLFSPLRWKRLELIHVAILAFLRKSPKMFAEIIARFGSCTIAINFLYRERMIESSNLLTFQLTKQGRRMLSFVSTREYLTVLRAAAKARAEREKPDDSIEGVQIIRPSQVVESKLLWKGKMKKVSEELGEEFKSCLKD